MNLLFIHYFKLNKFYIFILIIHLFEEIYIKYNNMNKFVILIFISLIDI